MSSMYPNDVPMITLNPSSMNWRTKSAKSDVPSGTDSTNAVSTPVAAAAA